MFLRDWTKSEIWVKVRQKIQWVLAEKMWASVRPRLLPGQEVTQVGIRLP